MNKRTWKDFITKRSTIWTLSLCMVGIIVLGSIAAVDSSRSPDEVQTETELGQVAYLEEELKDAENLNDTVIGASEEDAADALEEVSGNTVKNGSASYESETSAQTDLTESEASEPASDTETSTPASEANSADSDTAENSEEAASSSILSEQALTDAGISFDSSQSLLWPSAGTIAIDYSMDKSVYFATLNQYKYNPALIISSASGNQVLASARGIVESIGIDEETGTTLVLNIGDGYRLTYGQLMEPAVSEGDIVETGDLLAYVSDPTKYYSLEGSNLYFSMTKDGEPVDPVLYLE